MKWVSSVTVENGNDAWHEPKPPAACLVTSRPRPPAVPAAVDRLRKCLTKIGDEWVAVSVMKEKASERKHFFAPETFFTFVSSLDDKFVCFFKGTPPKKTIDIVSYHLNTVITLLLIFLHIFLTLFGVSSQWKEWNVSPHVFVCVCSGECAATPLQSVEVSDATSDPVWQTVQLTAHRWPHQVGKKKQ